MLVRADFMAIEWSGWPGGWLPVIHQRCIRARPGLLRDMKQDGYPKDVPKGLESPP